MGNQLELEYVLEEINTMISTYDYPIHVLQDVEKRLLDCKDVYYAKQQLRYLVNLANSGLVKKEEAHG